MIPIPTLLPETTRSPLLYSPIITVLSAKTSNTGSPAIVFTDIKESERSSEMLNNCPPLP